MSDQEVDNYDALNSYLRQKGFSIGAYQNVEYYFSSSYLCDEKLENCLSVLKGLATPTEIIISEDIHQRSVVVPSLMPFSSYSTQYQNFQFVQDALIITDKRYPYILILW